MTRRFRILILFAIALAGLAGAAILTSRTQAQVPPGTVTYRYDSLGRVVQDVYPAKSAGYNYDAASNWVSFTLN